MTEDEFNTAVKSRIEAVSNEYDCAAEGDCVAAFQVEDEFYRAASQYLKNVRARKNEAGPLSEHGNG